MPLPTTTQEAVMGKAVPAQHPAVVLRSHYKLVRALLAVAMVAVVGLAAAVVIVAGDSDEVASTSSASPHQGRVAQPPSTRYDGGPEEGTRGAVSSGRPESAPIPQQEHPLRSRLGTTQSGAPITSSRYDGGPEEGTRGMPSSNAPSTTAAGVRFDGGPEEGSRGLGR
jgi:hypothetical protein